MELEARRARRKIGRLAQEMATSRLSFIEGARLVCDCTSGLAEDDSDLIKFVGIVSETDAFPAGSVRDLWAPETSEALCPEMERSEVWAREFGRSASESLVLWFYVAGPGAADPPARRI